ncbi:MAG: hypothetical protein IKE94_05185 [Aeriscardovia sp.]|nr:hypothetical protein [Aeriscardovia sp.]MBR3359299.1 hypothetical protein [Aeriscardovia sp.]
MDLTPNDDNTSQPVTSEPAPETTNTSTTSSSHEENTSSDSQVPHYGKMMSDYPNYNPYLFGEPTKPAAPQQPQQNGMSNQQMPYMGQQTPMQNPNNQGQNQMPGYNGMPFGAPQQNGFYNNSQNTNYNNFYNQNFQQPQYQNPNFQNFQQNPYEGKWDGFAIIAFVASFFGLWFVSLPLAMFSLMRVKKMHMRGKGLAIAAIVLTIATFVFSIVMYSTGMEQQLLNWATSTLQQNSATSAFFM